MLEVRQHHQQCEDERPPERHLDRVYQIKGKVMHKMESIGVHVLEHVNLVVQVTLRPEDESLQREPQRCRHNALGALRVESNQNRECEVYEVHPVGMGRPPNGDRMQ